MASRGRRVSRLLLGGLALAGGYAVLKESYWPQTPLESHLDAAPVSNWSTSKLPQKFILELDLDRYNITETSGGGFNVLFGGNMRNLSLRRAVSGIKKAGGDDRVQGFLATGHAGLKGVAQIQELQYAIKEFKMSKHGGAGTMYYYEDATPRSNGILPYYFGAVFDKVAMQPSGMVLPMGFAVQVTFLREFLDRHKIEPIYIAREEYKNAGSMFVDKEFSKPHKESMQALLDSSFSQVTSAVSEFRGMTMKEVQAIIDSSPMTAEEALNCKMVDKLAYRDEVYQEMQKGGDLPRVSLRCYLQETDKELRAERREEMKSKQHVAVVTVSGTIASGYNKGNPKAPRIASGLLTKTLQNLREKPEIKALVLRIDSAGGTAVASDTIRRELVKVRESGRPVIVSMGNTGASGAYYIATGADKITALPGTLTGSIGILVGKPHIGGLLAEHGVKVEEVSVGKNSLMFSPLNGLDEEQIKHVGHILDDGYEKFVDKVCEARGFTKAEGQARAKGRVWSGLDAFNLGLVDRLGGLETAIGLAAEAKGLRRDEVVAVGYPPPRSPFKELTALLDGGGDSPTDLSSFLKTMISLQLGTPASDAIGADGLLASLADIQGYQMLSMDALLIQNSMSR